MNATFAFTVDKKVNGGASTSRPPAKPAENKNKGPTLQEKKDKQYSFKKECTGKIFRHALKLGLKLPEPRRPDDQNHVIFILASRNRVNFELVGQLERDQNIIRVRFFDPNMTQILFGSN